jgi:tetratricopeptide (TPR) repeat protein
MFFQLKMFECLTTRPFKLTESDLGLAQRLRLLCMVEDWESADALCRTALRVAEKFVSGCIPEEVCQIYADVGLTYNHMGKHALAMDICRRAVSIAQEFGYASLESSSSANLGYAFICARKWENAVEALEHARTCMESQESFENGAQQELELVESLAEAYQVRRDRAVFYFCPLAIRFKIRVRLSTLRLSH